MSLEKIVIYNSTYLGDAEIRIVLPLEAAIELEACLRDQHSTNEIVADALRDIIQATRLEHSDVKFITKMERTQL